MKLKLLPLLFSLVLSLTPIFAQTSGSCGENVTWSINAGTLTISGTGAMTDYESPSDQPWAELEFTSLIIEDGVTHIGNRAFMSRDDLESAICANTITSIGESAFCQCNYLVSISLPANITEIPKQMFYNCDGIRTITIPEGVVSIGESAFWGCSRLEKVNLPNSVTTFERSAFDGCDALSSINMPTSLTTIGREALQSCAMPSITLPSTLTSIGTGAFHDAEELEFIVCEAVNPPTADEFSFKNGPEINIPVYVPSESVAAYQEAEGWNYFTNIQAIPASKHSVTTFADHGSITGAGVYAKGTDVTLTATPDEGFEFQMWSDGTTDNPKTFTLTKDTTFRALFYMPEVEQEVVVEDVDANSVTIKWDTVQGATLYKLRIYRNAQLVAYYEVDNENNILDETFYAPQRIVARRDSTGGSSETLQVNITGLEAGQDYTYSLDALDDSRNYVGSQSGEFTTDGETGIEETQSDPRKLNRTCKEWRDGQLYIRKDGRLYNAQGLLLE